MSRHGLDGRRQGTGGPPDARIVKEDDLAFGAERVGHRRIPVIQSAGKVLQTKERPSRAAADTAIRVSLVPDAEKLRWRGRVGD